MTLGCLLFTISDAPDLLWIICIPPNTPPSGAAILWSYVFYLSKILEFLDTLLIILSNSIQRLTFLHDYSVIIVVCYIWLEKSQSLFSVVLILRNVRLLLIVHTQRSSQVEEARHRLPNCSVLLQLRRFEPHAVLPLFQVGLLRGLGLELQRRFLCFAFVSVC